MRPTSFDEIAGQRHLFGKNGSIRKMADAGYITNMIFYGPPGTGKTTAADIIAKSSGKTLHRLNATTASLDDIKAVAAETETVLGQRGILLYLDEIQYFNKKQQQSLLEYIEDGRITLIASTTENPFFYVYPAIISRCAVFEFKPVSPEDCVNRLDIALRTLNEDQGKEKTAKRDVLISLARICGGDLRRSISLLEHVYFASGDEITGDDVESFVPEAMKGTGAFSKDGDGHYDLLSAFQKSIRGSDPDASVFYLARLLAAGELLSVCRRLRVIASEDIGLAHPVAAAVVHACCESAVQLGLPEAGIPLSEAVILLATSPKSAEANFAYGRAMADVKAGKGKNIPDSLRDSHYSGAEKLDHGRGYIYPQGRRNNYVSQQYLPDDIKNTVYYEYGTNKTEQAAKAYWERVKEEEKGQK